MSGNMFDVSEDAEHSATPMSTYMVNWFGKALPVGVEMADVDSSRTGKSLHAWAGSLCSLLAVPSCMSGNVETACSTMMLQATNLEGDTSRASEGCSKGGI